MMNPKTKTLFAGRVKRVAGQVAGIQRMVEEDRYCIDVLMQISAARAALAKAGKLLLEAHIRTCVIGAFDSMKPAERAKKIEELIQVFDKNCK